MMNLKILYPLILVAAMSAPAQASSLPRADFGRAPVLGLGVGNGVSVSFDAPISNVMSIGGSFNAGLVSSRWSSVDVRLLYKFVQGGVGRPTVDLLVGAQGGGNNFAFSLFEPVIGIGLAYGLTPKLNLRGILAAGVFGRNVGPSGIELGYEFTPSLEGTIGGNGRGDFLGLKFSF